MGDEKISWEDIVDPISIDDILDFDGDIRKKFDEKNKD
jgi:hypothetical protein